MLRGLSLSIVLVALGAGLILWHDLASDAAVDGPLLPEPGKQTGVRAASDQVQQRNQQLQRTRPEQLPDPGPLPASLQGASQSVRLAVDSSGHFLPARDSLQLFEFYLAGIGEEPLPTVLLRIHHAMAAQLAEPALSEARDLLRRYLDYRLALMSLPAFAAQDMSGMQQRFTRTQQLRQQFFSADEYQQFFAQDELEDQRLLAQLANPEDREQIEARFEQNLTPEQRASRVAITRDGELFEQAERLRSQGASDEDIFQLRAAELGSQAATELAALDQQRAVWAERMQQYINERQRILSSGLAPQDERLAIEQLLANNFSQAEKIRARALSE